MNNNNKSFDEIVTDVIAEYKDKPLDDVNLIVELICETYVMKHGKKPDGYQLTLLANLILQEDFANPAPNKVQTEEYPFHSIGQAKRRKRKEFVAIPDTLDHMNFKAKANLSTSHQETGGKLNDQ